MVREISGPVGEEIADTASLADMIWANAERAPDAGILSHRVDGDWVEVSAAGFADRVLSVARGLIVSGIAPGDRVAMLSATRFEWPVIEFAVWAIGGVTVSLYDLWSTDQLATVLADVEPAAVVLETREHRETMGRAAEEFAARGRLWTIESDGGAGPALDVLVAAGAELPDERVWERVREVTAADLATLIYTAGEVERPRAVQLTHRNILAEVRCLRTASPRSLAPGNTMLLFLPLAHVFARAMQCAAIQAGVTVGYSPDKENLVADLRSFRPSFVLAVPVVFDKIRSGLVPDGAGRPRRMLMAAADRTAVAWSRAGQDGRAGVLLRARHGLFDRVVYRRVRAALGGRCGGAVCGGGPLDAGLAHFFFGVGVPILEGYGLTETSGGATGNTDDALKVGTAGRPMSGVTVRVTDDDHVLIRGDMVTSGYRGAPEKTREKLVDGWLHTGDLGHLDDEGFLTITGNTKDMLVTTAAENIAYVELEDRLRGHPLLDHCVVLGHDRPFATALVTLDHAALPGWLAEHGRPESTPVDELVEDPQLRDTVQEAIDDANTVITTAYGIRRFRVLPVRFDELDPDGRPRRDEVTHHYRDEIDRLYASA